MKGFLIILCIGLGAGLAWLLRKGFRRIAIRRAWRSSMWRWRQLEAFDVCEKNLFCDEDDVDEASAAPYPGAGKDYLLWSEWKEFAARYPDSRTFLLRQLSHEDPFVVTCVLRIIVHMVPRLQHSDIPQSVMMSTESCREIRMFPTQDLVFSLALKDIAKEAVEARPPNPLLSEIIHYLRSPEEWDNNYALEHVLSLYGNSSGELNHTELKTCIVQKVDSPFASVREKAIETVCGCNLLNSNLFSAFCGLLVSDESTRVRMLCIEKLSGPPSIGTYNLNTEQTEQLFEALIKSLETEGQRKVKQASIKASRALLANIERSPDHREQNGLVRERLHKIVASSGA